MASKQWQLATGAARRYEEILVPSILGPFAQALVDWADLTTARTVVDIGCGTGSATRFAAMKVVATGQVIGIDVNEAMLSVAQSLPDVAGATLIWQQEMATNLSMNDETADAVLCAQALQFIGDHQQALSEMRRILKTDKSAYISLWCDITQNPYFNTLVNTIAEHIGEDTAMGLRSAFNLSNIDEIPVLMNEAGFSQVEINVSEIVLNLPSVAEFVPKHIQATPMGAGYKSVSEITQKTILDQVSEELKGYLTNSRIRVPFSSYLIKATK